MGAAKGDRVTYTLRLTLSDGRELLRADKNKPEEIVLGEAQVLPSIEAALVGMEVSDRTKLEIDIRKEFPDGYFEMEMDRKKLPDSIQEGGAVAFAQATDGLVMRKVLKLRGEIATLDALSPLLHDLVTAELKIISIDQIKAKSGS